MLTICRVLIADLINCARLGWHRHVTLARHGGRKAKLDDGAGFLLEGHAVGKRADDGGGAAGDVQPGVNVLQVLAHGSFRQA
jgi:hypothetical protein